MQNQSPDAASFPHLKRVAQITNAHCGPAALQMLYSFLRENITQEEIVKAAGIADKISQYGMTVQEMALAVKTLTPDITFWYKDHADSKELDYLINKVKYPVGIEWQGVFLEYEDDDDGHYSVVTHIDLQENLIQIADPFNAFAGTDRTFPLENFVDRWWEINEIVNPATKETVHQADDQVMFILIPSDQNFPLQLGMKSS